MPEPAAPAADEAPHAAPDGWHTEQHADAEATPQHPPAVAGPTNESVVFQGTWQIQHGCRSDCHGTSQSESSSQSSETTQTVSTAPSTDGSSSSSGINLSFTAQFVWQVQLGCVALCFDTSQEQSAGQSAQTSQSAGSEADVSTWSFDISQTVQIAYQFQEGCRVECHGATSTRSLSQAATTTQSATATAHGVDVTTSLAWLTSLAQNFGATVQTLFQYQEADCLEHCFGGSQVQLGVQIAETVQHGTAGDGARTSSPSGQGGAEPPAPAGPGTDAPAEQQPASIAPSDPVAVAELDGGGGAELPAGAELRQDRLSGSRPHGHPFSGRAVPPRTAQLVIASAGHVQTVTQGTVALRTGAASEARARPAPRAATDRRPQSDRHDPRTPGPATPAALPPTLRPPAVLGVPVVATLLAALASAVAIRRRPC